MPDSCLTIPAIHDIIAVKMKKTDGISKAFLDCQRVTVIVDKSDWRTLRQVANARRLSASALVRELVAQGVKRLQGKGKKG